MKYLVQNRKEFTITIVALIVAIMDILKVFGVDVPNFSEEYLLTIVSAIVGALIWFYNMPTSKENCEATGEMRLRKAEKKGINGEVFYGGDEDE
jgi:uncharacterized membrane protein